VLGRGCDDTYSVSNNDNNNALGPRSEILPASGQWGRCGSVFDTNCDGVANAGSSDPYYQRLTVNEAQIAPSRNPGASWLFESWYAAREDIDIYNSMASLQTAAQWSGGVWAFDNSDYKLGAAIDRWVSPQRPVSGRKPPLLLEPLQWSQELVADGSHAKVAVKVSRLGNGLWRYHYAVMNLDFAFALTQGAEPNLRIVSQQGFDGFEIASAVADTAQDLVFRDGDLDAANNWQATQSPGTVRWSTGPGAQTTSLGWGMLYSFSLTSSAAPRFGVATLSAANAATPRSFTVKTIVPTPVPPACSRFAGCD
jgi:hypothetical protein